MCGPPRKQETLDLIKIMMPVFKGMGWFSFRSKMEHFPGMSEKENSFLCGDGHFENIVFYQGLLLRNVNRT